MSTDSYEWRPYISPIEPQHADEEAAECMERERIRIAAETLGVDFDERHVTAATWDLAGFEDGYHNMWRIKHGVDSDLVARVADVARWNT
ncbi:hypothetical protein CH305_18325 [Rhodococcus sp. 15-649-2-2]|uniref:hypothetical protein n=1 Tax=Rhodococcus sp. 15-649-2-2 TaxID=2023140 RepID=UPI000B9BAAB6|nr:hypothetical protein [Rhodococcus sp. 15-649-2-2]OZE77194.1 hypothetical protein CH305_18325 [Rhodococcus sp. 15-649-2-2]